MNRQGAATAVNDRLTIFLYILLRDHLPCGEVERIMVDHVEKARGELIPVAQASKTIQFPQFSNPHLESYARELAERLG